VFAKLKIDFSLLRIPRYGLSIIGWAIGIFILLIGVDVAFAQQSDPIAIPSGQIAIDRLKTPDGGLDLIPVGVYVNSRSTLESLTILGREDGSRFTTWLVPFDEIIKALKIRKRMLPDGSYELSSSGIVAKLTPQDLVINPRLGLAISIDKLQKIPGIIAKFDLNLYALDLSIPTGDGDRNSNSDRAIDLAGLSAVNPNIFSLSGIQQQISASGGSNSKLSTPGEFSTVGSMLGGSWFFRLNQPDIRDVRTWKVGNGVYINQNPQTDIIIGSQTPTWRRQGTDGVGSYWGASTISRSGFVPPERLSGGDFVPNTRLESGRQVRTVSGVATPGTLVRLVRGLSTEVYAQTLVDSTGVFRFDNVPIRSTELGSGYRLLLYPQGQLTVDPQVRDVTFSTLPGQIPAGTSAWVASAGYNRLDNETFLGRFNRPIGAVQYRRGWSESLTVGGGVVYDRGLRGTGELVWLPGDWPLEAAVSAVTGDTWDVVGRMSYKPTPSLRADLDIDRFSTRGNLNWQVSPAIGASLVYNTQDNSLGAGGSVAFGDGNSSTNLQFSLDNSQRLRWNLSQRFDRWLLNHQTNEVSSNSELSYQIPIDTENNIDSQIVGSYQTNNQGATAKLAQLTYRYKTPSLSAELGYGKSQGGGSGVVAALGTTLVPGFQLLGRYQGVTNFGAANSYSVEFRTNLDFQNGVRGTDLAIDRLQTVGGITLQTFFDRNRNGKRDRNEDIHWDKELIALNYKQIDNYESEITGDRTNIRLPPGSYRLDFDPAGLPENWQNTTDSMRVNVSAGAYTLVQVPLVPAYQLMGQAIDPQGNPLAGARVEAIPLKAGGNKLYSIANDEGRYTIERLEIGKYRITVGGLPANPETIEFSDTSQPIRELNLSVSNITTPPAPSTPFGAPIDLRGTGPSVYTIASCDSCPMPPDLSFRHSEAVRIDRKMPIVLPPDP
jgi:hypothetical protein